MVQFGAGPANTGAVLQISLARRGSSQKGRGTDGEGQRRGVQEHEVLGCRDVKDASLADGTVQLVDSDIRERGEKRGTS